MIPYTPLLREEEVSSILQGLATMLGTKSQGTRYRDSGVWGRG